VDVPLDRKASSLTVGRSTVT